MSDIKGYHVLVPPRVSSAHEKIHKFATLDMEFEDDRSLRRAGRCVRLLVKCCDDLKPVLEASSRADPFAIGVYAALDQGPMNYACATQLAAARPEDFPEVFRKFCPPTQHLKSHISMGAAFVGIRYGIMGPLYTYSRSDWACFHALDQAELDLCSGKIKVALVISAFSAEDPMLYFRPSKNVTNLCEGGAAIVLMASANQTAWDEEMNYSLGEYGIATPLIEYAQRLSERRQ